MSRNHAAVRSSRSFQGSYFMQSLLRPAAAGLLTAVLITVALISICSLAFAVAKSIIAAAVVPLSLISVSLGCFAGAYIAASALKKHGLIIGLSLAGVLFGLIWIISLSWGSSIFGSENVIKLLLLVFSGAAGGFLGCSKKHRR